MSDDFAWQPEYDIALQRIASDAFDTPKDVPEWPIFRNIIKHKLSENTALFLVTTERPPRPPNFPPLSIAGGLKLPPFPPRQVNQLMTNDPPMSYMSEEQANQMKKYIFDQLDTFDAFPFTIQRVCELCVDPKKHYKAVGKYLRAVEKSLLVTSGWDSFPISAETATPSQSAIIMSSSLSSTSATPLFSPIPFLHNDARRSQSRSPPPSPLVLGAAPSGLTTPEPFDALDAPKALGLVDELDDPSPGHLSEHPVALTSVTTIGDEPVRILEDKTDDDDPMIVDEDKENKK